MQKRKRVEKRTENPRFPQFLHGFNKKNVWTLNFRKIITSSFNDAQEGNHSWTIFSVAFECFSLTNSKSSFDDDQAVLIKGHRFDSKPDSWITKVECLSTVVYYTSAHNINIDELFILHPTLSPLSLLGRYVASKTQRLKWFSLCPLSVIVASIFSSWNRRLKSAAQRFDPSKIT